MNSLTQLSDTLLHSETKRLVGSSNALTAQLLAHLGEVEARGIHRERACSSLYTYCVYELRMSEDEAQRRCRAARLARQFPILLEMLADASLHLTGILLLGPHLTDENCAQLLARARFRTKREIERLVAEIAPCPDVPSRIVPLYRAGASDWTVSPLDDVPGLWAPPRNTWAAYVRGLAGEVRQIEAGLKAGQAPPRAQDEPIAAATSWHAADSAVHGETGARTPATDEQREASMPATGERRGVSSPALDEKPEAGHDVTMTVPAGESQPTASASAVAELRYKVQFTADQAYVELLEEARNLLQHELPSRDLVAVQRRALELLVHKLRQRKYADRERPRPKASQPVNGTPQAQAQPQLKSTPAPPPLPASVKHARHSASQSANQSRYIPAEVRRSVWKRDEARCTFVDDRGQRCREQSGLEFHHQHPHARQGPASIDNLALRCRSHNELAAEQDFGRDVIRKNRARRAAVAEPHARAGAAP